MIKSLQSARKQCVDSKVKQRGFPRTAVRFTQTHTHTDRQYKGQCQTHTHTQTIINTEHRDPFSFIWKKNWFCDFAESDRRHVWAPEGFLLQRMWLIFSEMPKPRRNDHFWSHNAQHRIWPLCGFWKFSYPLWHKFLMFFCFPQLLHNKWKQHSAIGRYFLQPELL